MSTEERLESCDEQMSLLTCQPPVPGSLCGVPPEQVGFPRRSFPKSRKIGNSHVAIVELDYNELAQYTANVQELRRVETYLHFVDCVDFDILIVTADLIFDPSARTDSTET